MPDGDSLEHIKTQKPDAVRIAGPHDESALVEFFSKALVNTQPHSVSPERITDWAAYCCHHPENSPHAIAGIIDGDGEIAGGICLVVTQPWFSDDWVIDERMIHVLPKYRSLERANNLLDFSRWCADQMEMTLYIGYRSKETKTLQLKSRLFSDKFTNCGESFLYDGAQ